MNIFENLFPQNLYHSYVIEGEPDKTAKELLDFLEVHKYIAPKSLDVLCQNYESFTMDDSLDIKDWHSKNGVTDGKRVCILATKFINREAEQALLKIIEEPKENTHFFIIVPDSSSLLVTILSRVQVIKTTHIQNKELKKEVLDFIISQPKTRVNMVAQIVKDNKDEENSGKLRYYASSFINELESIFYDKFKKDINNKNTQFVLSELQKARGYLSTSGASVKMILEHLALVI